MIRFQCPRCRSTFDVPDSRAGFRGACPKCGQRLQVPRPPPSKTVLAPLVEHWPEPAPVMPPVAQVVASDLPFGHPASVPQPLHAFPDPAPIIDARRIRRPHRRPWVMGVAVLLSLTALGLALRLLLTGGHFRSAGSVAEKRSHTRSDEEALVKTFILNNTPDADVPKVKFLVWGPHLDNAEMRQLLDESGVVDLAELMGGAKATKEELRQLEAFRAVVRVSYRAPEKFGWMLEQVRDVPDVADVADAPQGRDRAPNKKRSRPEKTYDELYMVVGKLVVPLGDNRAGDGWKAELRKELSKFFPGVKRR